MTDGVALGNAAGQERSENIQRLTSDENFPVLAYCTPEYLVSNFSNLKEALNGKLGIAGYGKNPQDVRQKRGIQR